MLVSLVMQEQWRTYVYCICPLLHRPIYDVSMNLFCWPQFRWHFSHFARFSPTTTLKSQCRKISRISNQFQKFQFWLIQPKHAFRGTISRNDIKKSPSALHFENFRKVPKFAKNTFFNSGNGCNFQHISTKQYKRAKAPIDLMLLTYLADIHSFKTP